MEADNFLAFFQVLADPEQAQSRLSELRKVALEAEEAKRNADLSLRKSQELTAENLEILQKIQAERDNLARDKRQLEHLKAKEEELQSRSGELAKLEQSRSEAAKASDLALKTREDVVSRRELVVQGNIIQTAEETRRAQAIRLELAEKLNKLKSIVL